MYWHLFWSLTYMCVCLLSVSHVLRIFLASCCFLYAYMHGYRSLIQIDILIIKVAYCTPISFMSTTTSRRDTSQTVQSFSTISTTMTASLHTLPVELFYRILDNCDTLTILGSLRNVCTRIDSIVDTYRPYQVNYFLIVIIDYRNGNIFTDADYTSPYQYSSTWL